MTEECYKSHPPLKVDKYEIYGGNCGSPKVLDADVYLALQSGSRSRLDHMPWENGGVQEVYFSIDDQRPPDNPAKFKAMVTWLCNQLQSGKKVHVGCIGGHGRTGLVLTAVVATLTKEKNAIEYVRENYCKKAVESQSQVEFLVKHFGVEKVKPRHEYKHSDFEFSQYSFASVKSSHSDKMLVQDSRKIIAIGVPSGAVVIKPLKCSRNLWTN